MRHLIALALVLSPGLAMTAGEDLVACRWPNGTEIKPQICEYLRSADARERAEADRQRASLEAFRARVAEEQAAALRAGEAARLDALEKKSRDDADAAIKEAARVERAAADMARFKSEEKARRDAAEKFMREAEQQDRRDAARAKSAHEARKKVCGPDLGALRLGMTLERAQQCVANFRLSSQTAMPGGAVSVYRAGWNFITVQNGVIVSFQMQ